METTRLDPERTWAGSKSRGAAVSYRTEVCYSFRSEVREVLGSETPRFHPASPRRDPIHAEHERERIDELHQLAYSTRRGGCRSGLRGTCPGGELFLQAAICTLHVRPVHPRARQSEGGDLHLRCRGRPELGHGRVRY